MHLASTKPLQQSSPMQVTDNAYKKHRVFGELDQYSEFYSQLATSIYLFPTSGTKTVYNIDAYIYSSIHGTIESIKLILLAGRINDAYALLRKYYDSAIINVWSNLYLHDNFSIENLVVTKIHNWLQGTDKLPEYREMSEYIKASNSLKPINELFYADSKYKVLRTRCNNHTHYNFFQNVIINDNAVRIKNRNQYLEQLADDVTDIFILHLGYIFFLKDHYMMSSDYVDFLDCNMQPEKNSQYWVAPFIQDIFNSIVTPRRPDITNAIKSNSLMQLS